MTTINNGELVNIKKWLVIEEVDNGIDEVDDKLRLIYLYILFSVWLHAS